MALLDLSLVTKTLIELVKRAIAISPAKPAQTVTVTSLPPDRVTDDNQIGIYLYHLVEEAAIKNQTWRGRPDQPIRFSPLGLNLHYIVTAHSDNNDSEGPYREQLLMGLTARALHDYPIIDDDTRVGGLKIVPVSMIGDENRLRVSLRHVPVNEAVSYWTAGSHPLRLCAYYEVSVVMIEPDEPTTASGRVLTWGVDTFVGGLPRLLAARSTVTFTIPGETVPRAIDIQPAQAALGDRLTLLGTGLGGGAMELLVRATDWSAPRVVGGAWGLSAAGDEVSVVVQSDVDGAPTIPGTWAASLRMTRVTTLADGTTKSAAVLTNETPFQIAPAITAFTAVSATGVFTATGGLFAVAAPTPPLVVRVSIAGVQLVPGTAGTLAAGQCAVIDDAHIQMRLPVEVVAKQWAPVRIVINGSESPPAWVQAP
jgi:hypothetical protein